MRRANSDPQYQRLVRARQTVAKLMLRGDYERETYAPIFMRLQREIDAHGERSLDAMLQDALS